MFKRIYVKIMERKTGIHKTNKQVAFILPPLRQVHTGYVGRIETENNQHSTSTFSIQRSPKINNPSIDFVGYFYIFRDYFSWLIN